MQVAFVPQAGDSAMQVAHQKLLTIITPNFNSGQKLVQTCASVAGQGVDHEHLIIDGVSTDGSLELARKLAENDPRIKVFSEKDRGPYDAFNKGISLAIGDFLYFLGAGDAVLPGRFKEIAAYLPKSLASLTYGDCILDGRRYDGPFNKQKLIESNICHQGIFYGRECFEICGRYSLKYRMISDLEFNMRCFGNKKIRKRYAPVIVAVYEGGGISAIPDLDFEKDREILIRKHFGRGMAFRRICQHYWGRVKGKLNRTIEKLNRGNSKDPAD